QPASSGAPRAAVESKLDAHGTWFRLPRLLHGEALNSFPSNLGCRAAGRQPLAAPAARLMHRTPNQRLRIGMELPLVKREEPIELAEDIWASAARIAVVGIFIIMFGLCLFFCRPVLLPVTAAIVIGTTFAPLVKALARQGVPSWVTAGVIGLSLVALA